MSSPKRSGPMFPLTLRSDLKIANDAELAQLVVAETDGQVKSKGMLDPDAKGEYTFSCDAMNAVRIVRRLEEDGWEPNQCQGTIAAIIDNVCQLRGYDADDYRAGLVATHQRVRVPFGLHPLVMARDRAERRPLRLLGDLAGSKGATKIAGIAKELQDIMQDTAILLPIDGLRQLVAMRKLVVSGIIISLMNAGILQCVDATYHTGKAKLYRFVGEPDRHYVYDDVLKEEDMPF